ncbi:MAG: hypothetical protein SWJ54_20590 [Cyanobacteriota bacterium]|nr:hypothetical protein [Cyanobacteriota bacterium]
MIAYDYPITQQVTGKNHSSLKQLVRSIDFAQDQFCLIIACCNGHRLRRRMIQQLHQMCPVHLEELTLDSSTETLYSTLARRFKDDVPGGVLVDGFESVHHLQDLLIATNYVREEFCHFRFPIVLWVNDDVMKQFVRLVPDFFSFALTGIEFIEEY